MSRRWTWRLTASFVLGAALLTGCSEQQAASETLPSASPAAPTEEELPPLGPEDMPMPAEARTQDAAGAEAFVRYYFDLLNLSLSDMDPQYLRRFADDGCNVCERIAQETENDSARQYRYQGGELTIQGDVTATMTGADEAQSTFIAKQAPLTVVDEGGTPVPNLVFGGKDALSSGTITTWDPATNSWSMTELTLG